MKLLKLILVILLALVLPAVAADTKYYGTPATGGTITPKIKSFGTPQVGGTVKGYGWGWLFNDNFTTDLAAGVVNGTSAEPGPGTRTVLTDPGSSISIGSGWLQFSSVGGDAILREDAVTRTPGKMVLFSLKPNGTTPYSYGGFSKLSSTYSDDANGGSGFLFGSINLLSYPGISSTAGAVPDILINNVFRSYTAALRAVGTHLLSHDGADWHLASVREAGNTATLYPCLYTVTARSPVYHDYLRLPTVVWMPTPWYSDSFITWGTTNGLGHAETSGIGAGGSGSTWTGGTGSTWGIVSGKATNTPTYGVELDTGNLVVGNWYRITASEVDHFFTGSAVGNAFRATATTALDANNTVKQITLTSMFATVNNGITSNGLGKVDCWRSAGLPIGLKIGDESNFLWIYLDGYGKCTADQYLGGVFDSQKVSAAVTYADGAAIEFRKINSVLDVYYNKLFVGTGIVNSTINSSKHGIGTGGEPGETQLDNFRVYPEPDKNIGYKPYNILNNFVGSSWSSTRTINIIGDSIIQMGAYVTVLMTLPNTIAFNNGVSGNTLDQITARIETDSLVRRPDYVVIEGGVNTLRVAVADPNTAMQTDIQTMVTKIIATGAAPILTTVTPFSGNANQYTWQDTYNAWIASYAAANGYQYIDFYGLMVDPGNPHAYLPAYDSGDHLHPSAAGFTILENAVKALF